MEKYENNNNDDTEIAKINIENTQDIEDILLQLYEKNLTKITTSSKVMQVTEIISYSSCWLFLILTAIRLSDSAKFSWLYLWIPGLWIISSLFVYWLTFLMWKDLIDETEANVLKNNNNHNNNNQQYDESSSIKSGNMFSYIILTFISVNAVIFAIIVLLRLENYIPASVNLNLIFIPFYWLLIASFSYAVFITPAFIANAWYFDISLIISYISATMFFSVWWCLKINNNVESMNYANVFIPLYFVVSAHLMYTIIKTALFEKSNYISKFFYCSALLLVLVSFILINLKNDSMIQNKDRYVEVVLLILAMVFMFGEKLFNLFGDEKEVEKDEDKQY